MMLVDPHTNKPLGVNKEPDRMFYWIWTKYVFLQANEFKSIIMNETVIIINNNWSNLELMEW